MNKTLLARVAALQNMPLSDLKALWRDVYQDELLGLVIRAILSAGWPIACKSLLTALICRSRTGSSSRPMTYLDQAQVASRSARYNIGGLSPAPNWCGNIKALNI